MNKNLLMTLFNLVESPTVVSADNEGVDVTCMRFGSDKLVVAFGGFNGNVYIRDTVKARLMYRIQAVRVESPITSIKWHPKLDNTIICTSGSGYVTCWHTETQQNLWTLQEEKNEVLCIDVSPAGTHFSTCGSDGIVRLYSMEKRVMLNQLKHTPYDQGVVTGHTDRLYATKFFNDDIVISSGWDNLTLAWDLRTGKPCREIFGTKLSGECLAVYDNILITGSNRAEDQLQFWDMGSGNLIKNISTGKGSDPLFVYTLQLTPDKKFVACGGGGSNRLAFYRISDFDLAARTERLEGSVNCVDFNQRSFGIGLSNAKIYIDKYSIS